MIRDVQCLAPETLVTQIAEVGEYFVPFRYRTTHSCLPESSTVWCSEGETDDTKAALFNRILLDRDDERAGFEEALGGLASFDLVSFSDRGIRLFRAGQHPPLRGTLIQLTPTNAILFTKGFVPYLGAYPGMRVPRPVEIVEHFGSASMSQLTVEILALTKMDWNSAMFAGMEPITTAFSEDVGHILAELPPGAEPRPQYRFYM